jgi:hypothetical protein
MVPMLWFREASVTQTTLAFTLETLVLTVTVLAVALATEAL